VLQIIKAYFYEIFIYEQGDDGDEDVFIIVVARMVLFVVAIVHFVFEVSFVNY
jgi:hypothetical protein